MNNRYPGYLIVCGITFLIIITTMSSASTVPDTKVAMPLLNQPFFSATEQGFNELIERNIVNSPNEIINISKNTLTIDSPGDLSSSDEITTDIIRTSPIIANHTIARLSVLKRIPPSSISKAKKSLKIFYAHTSHGSQITTGMTGLATFAGAPQPSSQFRWNKGGINGALNLADYYGDYGDLGHSGDLTWATYTRTYLRSHPGINVVMWSWCGGVSDNTVSGINAYLNAMNKLEQEFPKVTFVYMTGHLDGTGVSGKLNIRNNQIRNYCRTHNKVLFDFADIESYNPDNVYYLNRGADDACYYDSPSYGNWAKNWQKTHKKSVYWYDCESAHSEPLNANMKAYAAWWLWAKIAGWDGKLNPYPSISSVTPPTGLNTKNLTVNITGSNFRSNPIVTLSKGTIKKSATKIQRFSSTLIRCILPIKNVTTGSWNITVKNKDGTQKTKLNAFKVIRPT